MLNDFSYGKKIWTYLFSVLSQITRLQTDGQTDRRDRILIARPCLHCMQRGKERRWLLCVLLTSSIIFGHITVSSWSIS